MGKLGSLFDTDIKKSDAHPKRVTKWIHYTKLTDNKKQYRNKSQEEIEALADLIESAGEVLQDLLVRKTDADEYEIIAGHSRCRACRILVEERGKKEYAFLPCIVRNVSEVRAEFELYNSNGRPEKTAYEYMLELESMKHLLETYPEEFPHLQGGRMVERLASAMRISRTVAGEYLTISNNLGEKGMQGFEDGSIKKSAALELSTLPEKEQEELIDNGITSYARIKEYKDLKTSYEENTDVDVPESGTQDQENRNVPESGTLDQEGKYSAEWFVRSYCEYLSGFQRQTLINICRQKSKNAERAKDIQEYMAPYGFSGGNRGDFNFDFQGYARGIHFNDKDKSVRMTYIQFVRILEKLYGPWDSGMDVQDVLESGTQDQENVNVPESGTQTQQIIDVPESGTQMEIGKIPNVEDFTEWERFINNFRDWRVWCRNEQTEEVFYRYELPNKSAIVVRCYRVSGCQGKSDRDEVAYFLLTKNTKHFYDGRTDRMRIRKYIMGLQN